MELQSPWLIGERCSSNKPLASLDGVLTKPAQRDDSLGVESTGFVDLRQEYIVQLIQFCSMCLRISYWLVDSLKNKFGGLASKPSTDLIPKSREAFLNCRNIRPSDCDIRPDPGVMVDVQNDIESCSKSLIHYCLYAIHPCWVNIPRWGLSGKMIRPSH